MPRAGSGRTTAVAGAEAAGVAPGCGCAGAEGADDEGMVVEGVEDAGIIGDGEPACGGAPVFGALAPGTSVSRRGPLAIPLAGGGVALRAGEAS